MNEVQSAFGLLQLKYFEEVREKRKIANYYRMRLLHIDGISYLEDIPHIYHNYAYFPILVDNHVYKMDRDAPIIFLNKMEYIVRYFYPLISNFAPYFRWNLQGKRTFLLLMMYRKVLAFHLPRSGN